MARAAFTAAIAAVWAAITAIEYYYYFLNLQQPGAACAGTTTTTTSPASAGDFQIFLTLVTAGGFYAAVALIYHHLQQAEAEAAADADAAGVGIRRVPDRVAFLLLAGAGLLVLQGVPGAVDDVVLGALGAAAFRALPAAATVAFFLGMMTLIFAANVRAGGEGGGAVAGDGQIPGGVLLSLLTKTAFAAAAGLVFMMAIALCAKWPKY